MECLDAVEAFAGSFWEEGDSPPQAWFYSRYALPLAPASRMLAIAAMAKLLPLSLKGELERAQAVLIPDRRLGEGAKPPRALRVRDWEEHAFENELFPVPHIGPGTKPAIETLGASSFALNAGQGVKVVRNMDRYLQLHPFVANPLAAYTRLLLLSSATKALIALRVPSPRAHEPPIGVLFLMYREARKRRMPASPAVCTSVYGRLGELAFSLGQAVSALPDGGGTASPLERRA